MPPMLQQRPIGSSRRLQLHVNPKPDADPPAEPAPKPAKPEPKPEAKQAPQPKPKAAPEAAPMEVDAPVHPSAKPAAQPPAQTHDQAPDGGEAQATAPLWQDPTGKNKQVAGKWGKSLERLPTSVGQLPHAEVTSGLL